MDAKLRKTFYRTAYILMIIFTVFSALCFLVPLCWMIPMTLRTKKAYLQAGTSDERRHTALGIWGLFVGGFIPGIITLLAANAFKTEEMNLGGNTRSMFYRTAYQLMIIKTVFSALCFLVSLAWCIPMTLRAKKAYKQVNSTNESRHTALAVWSFFFIGVIPALFLLFAANEYKVEEINNENSVNGNTSFKTTHIKWTKEERKAQLMRIIPLVLLFVFALIISIVPSVIGISWVADGVYTFNINGERWDSSVGNDVSKVLDTISGQFNSKFDGIAGDYSDSVTFAWVIAVVLAWCSTIICIPYVVLRKQKVEKSLAITILVLTFVSFTLLQVALGIMTTDQDNTELSYLNGDGYNNWQYENSAAMDACNQKGIPYSSYDALSSLENYYFNIYQDNPDGWYVGNLSFIVNSSNVSVDASTASINWILCDLFGLASLGINSWFVAREFKQAK